MKLLTFSNLIAFRFKKHTTQCLKIVSGVNVATFAENLRHRQYIKVKVVFSSGTKWICKEIKRNCNVCSHHDRW